MVRLYIIRHAESQWNPIGRYQGLLDPELSQRGKKQANLLAKELLRLDITAIYSSPLKRTMDTAKPISEAKGIQIIPDKRIIEIDHGVWSGMLVDQVKQEYPEDFEKWIKEPHKIKFPGGESLTDVYERVREFLHEIKQKHWNQTVLVFSHTVPIRAMYCALLDIDLSKFWSFGCDNASYSQIHMEEDRNVVIKLNHVCHLGAEYVQAHKAL